MKSIIYLFVLSSSFLSFAQASLIPLASSKELSKKEALNTDYQDILHSNDDYPNLLASLSNEELLILINKLPTGYRIVFNLYVIDGYSHSEIGEMLGVSENTSKSQLSRAKELLRKQLKPLGIISYERT